MNRVYHLLSIMLVLGLVACNRELSGNAAEAEFRKVFGELVPQSNVHYLQVYQGGFVGTESHTSLIRINTSESGLATFLKRHGIPKAEIDAETCKRFEQASFELDPVRSLPGWWDPDCKSELHYYRLTNFTTVSDVYVVHDVRKGVAYLLRERV